MKKMNKVRYVFGILGLIVMFSGCSGGSSGPDEGDNNSTSDNSSNQNNDSSNEINSDVTNDERAAIANARSADCEHKKLTREDSCEWKSVDSGINFSLISTSRGFLTDLSANRDTTIILKQLVFTQGQSDQIYTDVYDLEGKSCRFSDCQTTRELVAGNVKYLSIENENDFTAHREMLRSLSFVYNEAGIDTYVVFNNVAQHSDRVVNYNCNGSLPCQWLTEDKLSSFTIENLEVGQSKKVLEMAATIVNNTSSGIALVSKGLPRDIQGGTFHQYELVKAIVNGVATQREPESDDFTVFIPTGTYKTSLTFNTHADAQIPSDFDVYLRFFDQSGSGAGLFDVRLAEVPLIN